MSTPTDEEFLNQLYESWRDDSWIDFDRSMRRDEQAAMKAMIAEGLYEPSEHERAKADLVEIRDLRKSFRGQFVEVLKQLAFRCLDKNGERVSHLPVGLLPTGELNACAVRTPRGSAVIILDHGMVLKLPLLLRSFWALSTYDEKEPFCRDHSKADFAATIRYVALHCLTNDNSYLSAITTWNCPSLPRYNYHVNLEALMIETFILLHEYAHVLLGHLHDHALAPFAPEVGLGLTKYTKSQEQEFEADQYALEHFVKLLTDGPTVAGDAILLCCGLLIHCFALCERLTAETCSGTATHPPALERWGRIKDYLQVSDNSTMANGLDRVFLPIK